MLAKALNDLEGRVRAAIGLVAKLKGEKALVERRVVELQAALTSQVEQIKSLQSGRKREQERLVRLQEEREEVRLKVDRLLEEIAKIEASIEPRP
ncbi:MAG: hypothetical protein ACREJ6_07335 [Candidatus Methylomirabilis sp.]